MVRVIRETRISCPVTSSDEVVITYLDPDELVMTQHKTSDGKFEKVMKPRRDVKKGLLPNAKCSNFKHPLCTNLPEPTKMQMQKEGKIWCVKIGERCPLEDFTHEKYHFLHGL